VLVIRLRPTSQQKRSQHIVGTRRSVNYEVAHSRGPVAVAPLHYRVEYGEITFTQRIQLDAGPQVLFQGISQQPPPILTRPQKPVGIIQPTRNDIVKHRGVLSNI